MSRRLALAHQSCDIGRRMYGRDMVADVRRGQARGWRMTAVDRGLALRSERPVRYRLPESSESEAAESTADHSDTAPSNGQRASTKAVNGSDG